MTELIIKFRHHTRDVRADAHPPPPLLMMIFIIFLMQTNIKIRHQNQDFTVPIVVAEIPDWPGLPGSGGGDTIHGS